MKTRTLWTKWLAAVAIFALFAACAPASDTGDTDHGPNPFLDDGADKADTGYVNLRGTEVEVTLEADVVATQWRIFDAPADLGQYAVTYLRDKKNFYLEILAEDATAADRVEWLVDGQWLTREQAESVDRSKLKRFRLREANSVVLNSNSTSIEVGQVYKAVVPVKPYDVYSEANDKCAKYDSHISLSQSVYWYLWDPTKSTCDIELQDMTVTVTAVFPRNPESYPEYDRLWEDNRLDVVVLWGKLDDGDVADDYNWDNVRKLAQWLTEAGFVEQDEAPLGQRFVKQSGDKQIVVDIYGPDVFNSVADYTHLANWQKAVREHEVVMYNGHSVLGSGMAFERAEYPDFYQIFQVASCLSYEYYVRPVLAGKGSWENVDVISNVEPTYYHENLPLTSSILAKLIEGFENNGRTSWQDIMEKVSQRLGHSRFGVSGARGNCFSPEGDRCGAPPPPDPDEKRYDATPALAIPDNNPNGVTTEIQVPDSLGISSLKVELDVTHTYVGDLTIVLSHNGVDYTLWNRSGGSDDDIRSTFTVPAFNGSNAQGTWKLKIIDAAQVDTGTLNKWALVVGTGGGSNPDAREYQNTETQNIPDNDPNGISSTINVPDSFTIANFTLNLDVTHTYVGDLTIVLSKDGSDFLVWDRQGGSADNIQQSFTTDQFTNRNASGTWTLKITDNAGRDLGTLNNWKLVLTPAE